MPVAGDLVIARQGHFWVGGTRRETDQGTVAAGHMFVQYQVPRDVRYPYPIVMVHGGGGQGLDFLGTPDGRPGWATFFMRKGFSVYVVDRPGHGRARGATPDSKVTGQPTFEDVGELLFGSTLPAQLHGGSSQWPGPLTTASEIVDQFYPSQGPISTDAVSAELEMQRAGSALMDRIGPAILLTHSLGGPFGWLVADSRPQAVKAIVAIEPAGPPFSEVAPGAGSLSWGITASPMEYLPTVATPSQLRLETRVAPRPGLSHCLVQSDPAAQLKNLLRLPVLLVTAERSPSARFDHGTVDFLQQAGVAVEHLRLEEVGIMGNGHMMMLERNSDEIAVHLAAWLKRVAPSEVTR